VPENRQTDNKNLATGHACKFHHAKDVLYIGILYTPTYDVFPYEISIADENDPCIIYHKTKYGAHFKILHFYKKNLKVV
jgi:hypothetical protein